MEDDEDDNDDVDMEAVREQPRFPKLSAMQAASGGGGDGKAEYRRVRCPPNRYTPLREHWEQILTPLVEYLKLQVGFASPFLRLKGRKKRRFCDGMPRETIREKKCA